MQIANLSSGAYLRACIPKDLGNMSLNGDTQTRRDMNLIKMSEDDDLS